MYAEIEQPLQIIQEFISNCLRKEVTDEGLLHDIKSYKDIYRDEMNLKTPAVWLYMQNWYPTDEVIVNRNNTRMDITFPVEVACISHRKKLDLSDKQATSIQGRIIESFIKNWRRKIDDKYNIVSTGFYVRQGYTDGNMEAIQQRETVTIKGVLIEFKFTIDWMRCIRIYEDEQKDTENIGG